MTERFEFSFIYFFWFTNFFSLVNLLLFVYICVAYNILCTSDWWVLLDKLFFILIFCFSFKIQKEKRKIICSEDIKMISLQDENSINLKNKKRILYFVHQLISFYKKTKIIFSIFFVINFGSILMQAVPVPA